MFKMAMKAAAFALLAGSASASTVGFTFEISGDTDAPTFAVTNTSASANLVFLSLHIGYMSHNFDDVQGLTSPTGGTSTIILGDTVNDGSGQDLLGFSFSSFSVGDTVSWSSDIDADGGDSITDYRSVLFNNGAANNALFVAVYDTGEALRLDIPDLPGIHEVYTYGATLDTATGDVNVVVAPIPLPASVPLLGAGLLALGALRARRKA